MLPVKPQRLSRTDVQDFHKAKVEVEIRGAAFLDLNLNLNLPFLCVLCAFAVDDRIAERSNG